MISDQETGRRQFKDQRGKESTITLAKTSDRFGLKDNKYFRSGVIG